MTKRIFLLIVCALVIASCQDKNLLLPKIEAAQSQPEESIHSIPIEKALASLNEYLEQSGDIGTKSGAKRTVRSTIPVKIKEALTRSGVSDTVDCENLVYVANFENDEGYAILAADDRISESVLAVIDNGTLDEETINRAVSRVLSNNKPETQRLTIDGYPLTGPGFFTDTLFGNEIFLNPNTANFYLESEHDTLVGNYRFDDVGEEYENGELVPGNDLSDEDPGSFASTLCLDYAFGEVIGSGDDDGFGNGNSGGPGPNNWEQPETGRPNKDGTMPVSIREESSYSSWTITNSVSPIFTKYVYWSQGYPYNELYPRCRKYIIIGRRRKAPAGCFPLAIGKVMAHFRFPQQYIHHAYTVDWDVLNYGYPNTLGTESAKHLFRGLAADMDSWYFYQGTFTRLNKAKAFMKRIGYTNVHSHSYHYDMVKEMLDNDCPVLICSVPNRDIFISHAWNIDGYKEMERTKTVRRYVNNELLESYTRTERREMIHCDLGWKGSQNGYFVSGIFKLNHPDNEKDDPTETPMKRDMSRWLKIVTYDKPL